MTEVVAEAELSRGPSSDKKINRKIAFCVAKWNDAVLTWAWLRQYFLHVSCFFTLFDRVLPWVITFTVTDGRHRCH